MMEKWLADLSEEDRNFIRRFVLASGSLKEMAKQYRVSYPTLRIRLDRLIRKIKVLDNPGTRDPLRIKLQVLVAEGMISTMVAKELIEEYEKTKRRKGNE